MLPIKTVINCDQLWSLVVIRLLVESAELEDLEDLDLPAMTVATSVHVTSSSASGIGAASRISDSQSA